MCRISLVGISLLAYIYFDCLALTFSNLSVNSSVINEKRSEFAEFVLSALSALGASPCRFYEVIEFVSYIDKNRTEKRKRKRKGILCILQLFMVAFSNQRQVLRYLIMINECNWTALKPTSKVQTHRQLRLSLCILRLELATRKSLLKICQPSCYNSLRRKTQIHGQCVKHPPSSQQPQPATQPPNHPNSQPGGLLPRLKLNARTVVLGLSECLTHTHTITHSLALSLSLCFFLPVFPS